jgi:uncharacterized protein (TIGR02246 family)
MPDHTEIARLRDLYAQYFDARDTELFAALFAEDGVMVVPGGKEFCGHDQLARLVGQIPKSGTHVPLDGEIVIDGDRARCTGPYRMIAPEGEQTGQYEDEFVRTTEGWRFARRAIIPNA